MLVDFNNTTRNNISIKEHETSPSPELEVGPRLVTSIEQCDTIQSAKLFKYEQQWHWIPKRLQELNKLSAVVQSINDLLIHKIGEALTSVDQFDQEMFNKYFPHLRNGLMLSILIQISYAPRSFLGDDFHSIPWKWELQGKAHELISHLDLLFKSATISSPEQLIDLCQKIKRSWQLAVSGYFEEALRPGNEWNGRASYVDDEYPLTQEQLLAVKEHPLCLAQEMSIPPKADIILIAGGCGYRDDQEYPIYIQKLAAANPKSKVKIFMIDPSFVATHPKAITEEWQAIGNDGNQVAYSNRFIKGNVEAVICREGFTCSNEESALISGYLIKALDRGARIFIGEHASPVASYLPKIYQRLMEHNADRSQLTLYSDHGGAMVTLWQGTSYSKIAEYIVEIEDKSKLYLKKDFAKELRCLASMFPDVEVEKLIADQQRGQLDVGCQLIPGMDSLSFD